MAVSYTLLGIFVVCFVSDLTLHQYVFPFVERPRPANVTSELGNETASHDTDMHVHHGTNDSAEERNQSEPLPPEIERHEGNFSQTKVHIKTW